MERSMMRSRYEGRIAVAARALREAAQLAEALGNAGGSDDLGGMAALCSTLLDESLRGKQRRRVPMDGQLEIPAPF